MNPGDLRDAFNRILGGAGGQIVEAEAPLFHEVVVVEVLLDDDVQKSQTQSRIGTGTQLQVIGGTRADPGETRVNRDELAPALHEVDECVTEEAVRVGEQRVLAPQHDVFRHHVARIVVSVREERRVVELGIACPQNEVRHAAARAVARFARKRGAGVGRLQRSIGGRRRIERGGTAGALEHRHGLVAVVLLYATHVLFDEIHGFVPGDGLPFVKAPVFAGTPERRGDPLVAVHVFGQRQAPRAKPALGNGVFRIALDAHDPAVLNLEIHAASYGMVARRRPGAGAHLVRAVAAVDELL